MADRKETIILEFEVDKAEAQKSLVQTEKNLLSLKKQQAELTKEYKAGKVSEDQYIESNIKLQKAIKNESDQKRTLTRLIDTESNSRNSIKSRISDLVREYDNLNTKTAAGAKRSEELQKELSELNAQITTTSKSAGLFKDQIGNYPNSFAQAASQIKVAGFSIDDIGTKLSSFINPATAVVGVLGGLASAYASSVIGARDLAKAQNLVASATEIATEAFGQFISELANVEDGGPGIFEGLVFGILNQLDTGLAVSSLIKANNKELIKDLEISSALSQAAAKEDERRAENARRIRDDESKSLQERLEQTTKIDQILNQSAQRSVIVIQAQINAIRRSTTNYDKNREAQLQVAQLTAEISDKQEEINGKLTENITARRAILKLIQEQNNAESADDRAQRRALDTTPTEQASIDIVSGTRTDLGAQIQAEEDARKGIVDAQIEQSKVTLSIQSRLNEDLLKINKDFYEKDLNAKKTFAELKRRVDEGQLMAAVSIAGAAASLFDQQSNEYKIFATAQTLISTYATAQKAAEAAFTPPTVFSPVLAATYVAAAIAQGLANVAAINGVQFYTGGYTGPGPKHKPAGTVHAGEVVWNQEDVKAVGGPAVANAMRPTAKRMHAPSYGRYADGGVVTTSISQPINQQMEFLNIVKNLPPSEVSVKEINKIQRRVAVKEQISKR